MPNGCSPQYSELHRLVAASSHGEAATSRWATTLLHEATRHVGTRRGVSRSRASWRTARAMRGLIATTRAAAAQKHGGLFELTSLQTTIADRLTDANGLQQISDALEISPPSNRLGQIVDLKFFCLRSPKSAPCAGMSERTVQRHWGKARLLSLPSRQGDAPRT
jgi:hypothetical protein